MNPPRSEGFVRMPDAEFEAILTRAAEEGANPVPERIETALAPVPLLDETAAQFQPVLQVGEVGCTELEQAVGVQPCTAALADQRRRIGQAIGADDLQIFL